MRKLIITAALASAVLFMANCTPKAAKAVAKTPGSPKDQVMAQYSADQLEAGKTLMLANCAKCHKLKEPETRTAAEWDVVLTRMIPKAKLSAEDGKLVRAYLVAHSKEG